MVSAVAVTLFWGGWLRPFPNVSWLRLPLNVGFPVILFGGSALLTIPMVKRLVDPMQKKVLVGVVVLLLLLAAVFVVPAINDAVIGLFWFLFKVSLIVYLMIWFPRYLPALPLRPVDEYRLEGRNSGGDGCGDGQRADRHAAARVGGLSWNGRG